MNYNKTKLCSFDVCELKEYAFQNKLQCNKCVKTIELCNDKLIEYNYVVKYDNTEFTFIDEIAALSWIDKKFIGQYISGRVEEPKKVILKEYLL
jgi:hypothetical protein